MVADVCRWYYLLLFVVVKIDGICCQVLWDSCKMYHESNLPIEIVVVWLLLVAGVCYQIPWDSRKKSLKSNVPIERSQRLMVVVIVLGLPCGHPLTQ